MASIGRVVISALSGTQEITAGLANFNFDFSLVKVAAPAEYQSIGQHLSKKRKLSAEDGSIHRTARKLGALFEGSLPGIPNLIRAYGLRASEVTENPEHKMPEDRRHGPMDDHIGLDGKAHWAAATSGPSALAVLLLACMIARSFTKSGEAVALWSEIVAARKAVLQEQLNGQTINVNSLTASQVEITREALAEWDASARSWLSIADKSMSRKQLKLMLIIDNLDLTVRSSLTAYENVMEVWMDAMTTVDKLISGVPLRMQKPGVLIGLSSWHLYPDISVLEYEQKLLKLDDHLVRAGGLLTVGMQSISPQITEGINWTMPLRDLRYYGNAKLTKGVSMISQWGQRSNGFGSIMEFLAAFGNAVTAVHIEASKTVLDPEVMNELAIEAKELNNVLPTEDSEPSSEAIMYWPKAITDAAHSYARGNAHYQQEFEQSVELGIRRFSDFFAPKRAHSLPGFGLCNLQVILEMMSSEGAIAALRALAESSFTGFNLQRAILVHRGDNWSEIVDLFPFKNPHKREVSHRRWVILSDNLSTESTKSEPPSNLRMTHFRNKDSTSPHDHRHSDISRAVEILEDLEESCGFVTHSQTISVQPTRWDAHELYSWINGSEEKLESTRRGLLIERHTPFWLRSDYKRVWNSPSNSLLLFLPAADQSDFRFNRIAVPLDFLTTVMKRKLLSGATLRRYLNERITHDNIPTPSTFRERTIRTIYFQSLAVLNSVSALYDTLQGALVNLSVLSLPLTEMKWKPPLFAPLGPREALSCISTFATGYHNLDPATFTGVIGLSYGNNLYMREFVLNDPWLNFHSKTFEQKFCCLIGTVDHPGLSLLVPVKETMRSEPDLDSWKLINHTDYDDRIEDNFSATALQLCLTGYVQPLHTGEHGTRDNDTFFVETVISVHERGDWIADINLLTMYPQHHDADPDLEYDSDDDSTDEGTLIISLPDQCTHPQRERYQTQNFSRIRSVDNWTEFMDPPADLCIVRAANNWTARMAICCLAIDKRSLILLGSSQICWACVWDKAFKDEEDRYLPQDVMILL